MPSVDDRFAPLRSSTASALLQGPGTTSADLRQAIARGEPPQELTTLVQKIRSRPYSVTDQDVDALRNRYTEDQLFEIIVAASFGAAQERLAAAHRALEDA
jgi:alkylhydroperoxidase family enzyme